MNQLRYENELGPAVRIGILQNQKKIRISLLGDYRVVSSSGVLDFGEENPEEFLCSVAWSTPAALVSRLVLLKSANRKEADEFTSPSRELQPLQTMRLGYEFSDEASSVEYWCCSRQFSIHAEAEALRETLPNPERISFLSEVATPACGHMFISTSHKEQEAADWIRFEPLNPEDSRVLVHDVIVGLEYHWRHLERQRFRGVVEIRIDNQGLLTVINELPAEAYLFSVNSSEMMSVMPDELLKAQTVAARNTLFATMGKHHYADAFHLCADDHCQCYRGSSRETPDSRRVTLATLGEVLVHNGAIGDCRYSKMCGGVMESFESVWNEDPRGYLIAGVDAPKDSTAQALLPSNTEERAKALIESKPDVWCNTTVEDVPQYLRYSASYFRWEVRYKRAEAEALLSRHLGTEIGHLRALEPLSRGASGRIEYLKVVTSQGEWTIGKEFQIRKALSQTFLYSSCFTVGYEYNEDKSINTVILRGAGWGHGAGLCQVGATMMAYRGKSYREILFHYYPNTQLVPLIADAQPEQFQQMVEHEESRVGERCFEFFNCYAVASCPIYGEGVNLIARQREREFSFIQETRETPVDLADRQIACQFLAFDGTGARPKS